MGGLQQIGKFLAAVGVVLALIGFFLIFAGRLPFLRWPGFRWIGRLPGDILIRKKNFTFYFPLATSIVISIILTLILLILRRR
ncbi:MAG: DUF2905 domain-containing protein [Nitrospiraceae bacterium]|nr:DUF2905 domain-containing protein [Nitrospiraceae bacterium]